jgi:hypothetical protein
VRRPWILLLLLCAACANGEDARIRETSKGKYDPVTGKLIELTYDKNQNGRIDTWVAMDGARPVSARVDADEDGQIDRWEQYDAEGRLTKVGESRAKTGKADMWATMRPDGTPAVIEFLEVSNVTGRDGVVRREFYENGAKARAEEDTDGDGTMDRWERFDAGRLAAVEFDDDRKRDGRPAQRFTYDAKGTLILIETDPDGHGGYRQRRTPGR